MRKSISKHCSAKYRKVSAYRQFGQSIDNPVGELQYVDNGADWLVVCHLDYVDWRRPKTNGTGIYKCPQLDDRLGAAIALDLLPTYVDCPYDILLCDEEETGQSTAEFFRPDKQYRFAVEFDRAGSDAVLYQYGLGTLEDSLVACGVEIGIGSFSDISTLEHLGCQCMNFGCGYHDQHTRECYAEYCEIDSQLRKFANWFQYHGSDAEYPWVPPEHERSSYVDDYLLCEHCGYVQDCWLSDDELCLECGCALTLI